MPEIESGAIASAVPIEAPAINRVRGIETIRRMMNGSERNPFTNAPITLFALAVSQMPPAAVPPRTAPSTTELGYLATPAWRPTLRRRRSTRRTFAGRTIRRVHRRRQRRCLCCRRYLPDFLYRGRLQAVRVSLAPSDDRRKSGARWICGAATGLPTSSLDGVDRGRSGRTNRVPGSRRRVLRVGLRQLAVPRDTNDESKIGGGGADGFT